MLSIEGLKVSYGHVEALKGIDLEVRQGKITAIIGSNGAGKTSTLMAISGLAPITAGDIRFEGQSITRCRPHDITRLYWLARVTLVTRLEDIPFFDAVFAMHFLGAPPQPVPQEAGEEEAPEPQGGGEAEPATLAEGTGQTASVHDLRHKRSFEGTPEDLAELRRAVYTTNSIENLNRQIRKSIKTRGHFPDEQAATKLIYLAIQRSERKWRRAYHWTAALRGLKIHFGDRLPD